MYESRLLTLFDSCPSCANPTSRNIQHVHGSMVKIVQECGVCQYRRDWCSQPDVNGKPAGNLLISSAILFSGSIPSKVLRVFKFLNMACISLSTFILHQRFYLYPVIAHSWNMHQQYYFRDVIEANDKVNLAGDGRADTPGHSAKYGAYSMLDLDEGVVVSVQLVQVTYVTLYL